MLSSPSSLLSSFLPSYLHLFSYFYLLFIPSSLFSLLLSVYHPFKCPFLSFSFPLHIVLILRLHSFIASPLPPSLHLLPLRSLLSPSHHPQRLYTLSSSTSLHLRRIVSLPSSRLPQSHPPLTTLPILRLLHLRLIPQPPLRYLILSLPFTLSQPLTSPASSHLQPSLRHLYSLSFIPSQSLTLPLSSHSLSTLNLPPLRHLPSLPSFPPLLQHPLHHHLLRLQPPLHHLPLSLLNPRSMMCRVTPRDCNLPLYWSSGHRGVAAYEGESRVTCASSPVPLHLCLLT